MVYEDAEKLYTEVRKDCEDMLEEAFDVIFPSELLSTTERRDSLNDGAAVVAFNTTFFPRRDIISLPGHGAPKLNFASMMTNDTIIQMETDSATRYVVVDCATGGDVGLPSCLPADCARASGSHYHFVVLRGQFFRQCTRTDRITLCSGIRTCNLQSQRAELLAYMILSFGLAILFIFLFDDLLNGKYSRELIAEGMTGGLVIFEDHPNYWDAWG